MGLLSTWWQNWVVEVEIKDFAVRQTQVGAGVYGSAFLRSVTSGKLLSLAKTQFLYL